MTYRLLKMKQSGIVPDIEIIPALNEEHAFFIESCLIEIFGRRDLGEGTLLNLTDGGEHPRRVQMSQSTKDKIGKANTGKVLSEATKTKLSKSLSGKVRSKEHCDKISDRQKKKGFPKEAQVAARLANTGRKHSNESRELMSANRTYKSHSPETKEKMRLARLAYVAKKKENDANN